MTAQWQRSTTPLRATSPMRMAPCASCGRPALSERAWSVCSECVGLVKATLGDLPAWQQRNELRTILHSPLRIRAAVAEQRQGATV